MFVCIDSGLTDNTMSNAIDEGSAMLGCLSHRFNVGTECNLCVKQPKQVLHRKLVEISSAAD